MTEIMSKVGSVYDASSPIEELKPLLLDLLANPGPTIPNPPNCKKRASVALIIRVRPRYPDTPKYGDPPVKQSGDVQGRIESFFEQLWVQRGDPEVLFIKRAARAGDRWTSHVALPGGKRDPEDESDQSTSVRETMEEIGLDLNMDSAMLVGNLPERVVTTSWGKVPLMVLCPFVYLLTRDDIPPLRLQPTEVNSVHWVSVRALLSPSLRTYERTYVSDRMARRGGFLLKGLLRLLVGQMMFAAVRLVPSESLYCSTVPEFLPNETPSAVSFVEKAFRLLLGTDASSNSRDRPLLLWGLTHGIMMDFLDLLPSHNNFKLWTWPTLSPWDLRIMVWVITHGCNQRKIHEVDSRKNGSPAIVEESPNTFAANDSEKNQWQPNGVYKDGLGLNTAQNLQARQSPSGTVIHLLEGYFGLMRRAVILTMLLRFSAGVALVAFILRRRRRTSSKFSL
ncbi:hypothetical protein MMC19_004554 [Ptychographa xylographoides]|nr:hypothetical protein [Ptychographa xylographoides]